MADAHQEVDLVEDNLLEVGIAGLVEVVEPADPRDDVLVSKLVNITQ